MRWTPCLMAVVVVTPEPVAAQVGTGAIDSAAITALEQQVERATAHGDVAALDSIYAPSFVFTHSTGTRESREQRLAALRARSGVVHARELDSLDIDVHGDVALTTGRIHVRQESASPRWRDYTIRYARVYVRRDGRWRLLTHHSTGESVGPLQPRPGCADSVDAALGQLVGRWEVRAVFRRGAAWDTSTGTAEIRPDLDGCLLREAIVSSRDGMPYRTHSLWGAVGLAEPIQRTFIHSQHGLLTVYAGRPSPAGLVLRDSQVVRGQLVLLEHRFAPFVADSMRFTSRRSSDHGATWTVTWYADYLRRGR